MRDKVWWSSRDGTMEAGSDKHVSFLANDGAPPPLNDPDALIRWEPWVRRGIAINELMHALTYAAVGADTFTVSSRTPAAELVRLTRPDLPFFQQQIPLVQSWAELRDERAAEILAQIDNQLAFIAAATGLNVSRKRWTVEWLMIAVHFTIAVQLMFKHAFACFRPVELSPQVQPIITTPGHGTYPMGHAAQAFATIVALRGLLGLAHNHPAYRQLYLQARRFSVNRVVAGVHFPIDAAAGQALGLSLGEYFVRASGIPAVTCHRRTFQPTGNGGDGANDYLGDGPEDPQGVKDPADFAVATLPFLETMAKLARAEWQL